MATIIDNPFYFQRFDEMVRGSRSSPEGIDGFQVLQWRRGHEVNYQELASVRELGGIQASDLTIITCPLDHAKALPDLRKMFEALDLPGGPFVSERLGGVTHSFGTIPSLDGKSQTSWMHFLGMAASKDGARGDWIKSGIMLRWLSKPSMQQVGDADRSPVILLCFEPTYKLLERLQHLVLSADWEFILQDPYILVDIVISTWYERLDESAWAITSRVSTIEKLAFNDTKALESKLTGASALDLYEAHLISKNAIHMLEGLNAALRSVDAVIAHHREAFSNGLPIWRVTHDSLRHHKELFHSTHLRISSIEKRLANVVQLAFNLDAMRNTRVMKQDSYSMKTVAVLGMTFLPIGTLAAIFGEQFFTSEVVPSPSESDGAAAVAFIVNAKFWLLWVIAIPVTAALLFGWWLWVRHGQRQYRRVVQGSV